MKRVILSLSLIAAFLAYLVFKHANLGTGLAAVPNKNAAPTPSPTPAPGPSAPIAQSAPATSATAPSTAPSQQAQGQYKDGSYVGSVADAWYGNVQVKAIVRNGAISDVQFLQYPNTHGYSIYVNSQAMPYLTQEAVQTQNANVDIISGATQTSLAFIQSLQSALAQAQN